MYFHEEQVFQAILPKSRQDDDLENYVGLLRGFCTITSTAYCHSKNHGRTICRNGYWPRCL